MNASGGSGVTLPYQSICVTCLSQDRKLFPVNDSKSQASFLLNLSEGDMLCWECHFFVRKVAAFRSRAARAQALLASAAHHADDIKINCLSSLMRTPVYLEISLETSDLSQVNVKTETIKEEYENTYPIKDNNNCDNVPCDDLFEELDDEELLPALNKQTKVKGDKGAYSDVIDDDVNASLKVLSGKDLLNKRHEHPCKLEPGREADATPEHNHGRTGGEPPRSQTLEQQFQLRSCFVGLEHIPPGDEQTSSYTFPVTFECNLKRKHVNQQATPHGGIVHTLGKQSRLCTPIQTQMVGKPYICNTCGKNFNTQLKFNRHITIHAGKKPFSCDKCGKRFKHKSALISHLHVHTGKDPFCCDTCDKRFYQKSALISHLHVHTVEKPLYCDICDKWFKYKTSLTKHLLTHTDEKRFSCDTCDKQFNLKSSLISHFRVHIVEKPISCNVCQKRFTLKCNMTRHLIAHSDEKPFSCDICNKRFKEKSTLLSHLRSHKGEVSYSCDICRITFATKSSLYRHTRLMHTQTNVRPFCCDICPARFKIKSHLNVHLRIHTGERRYGCDVCGKRFNESSVLKAHLRIHTGEKPFCCEICGKRFNQKSPMKTHLRTHK